jgi:predicted nucleotidyltransferase
MRIGKKLLLTEFGSSVYGTRTPTSDHDYKGIFVPHFEDILLQKVSKTSFQENTRTNLAARNSPTDSDLEWITLQAFIRLCSEGQSMAIDILFTPKSFWKEHSTEWEFIQQNRAKLLSQKISAIVGYCQQQAAKYGIKGSRLAAVRHALDVLKGYPQETKLNEVDLKKLKTDLGENKHISFVDSKTPAGIEEQHLEVCNRKVPIHANFKYALHVFGRIYEQYGERARQAEANEGVDWKALMHAVRVSEEAKELLTSRTVTFPRPERTLLLQIRNGELPYDEVAEKIEQGLQEVEDLQEISTLPKEMDMVFWEAWMIDVYGKHISRGLNQS